MAMHPICRLVAVIQPSLLMYLADSGIWSYTGDESIKLACADAVDDLKSIVDRASVILRDREVMQPVRAAYPLSFTGLHDVDLRSLLLCISGELSRQLDEVNGLTVFAGVDAAVADLVTGATQSIRQHRDVFDQLAARLKSGLSSGAEAGPSGTSGTAATSASA